MATSRNVDFSSVKDGGTFNKRRIPGGDYLATVTKVEDAQAKDDTFQYLFTIKIDSRPSSVFPYYCKLQENQLWKLRNLMIAAGLTVPKKKVKVDPNRVVGRKIGVTVEDDEYEGKEQSTIAAVFPAAELSDGGTFVASDDDDDDEVIEDEELEEEVEEVEEEVEEDEEEEDADPLADLDRAALKAELKKLDATFKAKVSQTDEDLRDMLRAAQAKAARAKAAATPKAAPKAPVKRAAKVAPVDDDEADDDDDLDIGEAPPAPVSTSRRGRKPKVDITTVTDDELDELDIDDM